MEEDDKSKEDVESITTQKEADVFVTLDIPEEGSSQELQKTNAYKEQLSECEKSDTEKLVSLSSNSSEECLICFEKISKDGPFATFESVKEGEKKYHAECLDEWLSKSGRGILSSDRVESYNLVHDGKIVDTIKLSTNNNQNHDFTNETTFEMEEEPYVYLGDSSFVVEEGNLTLVKRWKIVIFVFIGVLLFLLIIFNKKISSYYHNL